MCAMMVPMYACDGSGRSNMAHILVFRKLTSLCAAPPSMRRDHDEIFLLLELSVLALMRQLYYAFWLSPSAVKVAACTILPA